MEEEYPITSMYLSNCVIYYINIGRSFHFIPISKYVLEYSIKPSSELLYIKLKKDFTFLNMYSGMV